MISHPVYGFHPDEKSKASNDLTPSKYESNCMVNHARRKAKPPLRFLEGRLLYFQNFLMDVLIA
jgi:hypothetical protein